LSARDGVSARRHARSRNEARGNEARDKGPREIQGDSNR
jgi:hypothetical protein